MKYTTDFSFKDYLKYGVFAGVRPTKYRAPWAIGYGLLVGSLALYFTYRQIQKSK